MFWSQFIITAQWIYLVVKLELVKNKACFALQGIKIANCHYTSVKCKLRTYYDLNNLYKFFR